MRRLRMPEMLSLVFGIVGTLLILLFAYAATTYAKQTRPGQTTKTIVLIGGPRTQGPAEHDHPNGIRVLQTILESSPDIKAFNLRVEAYPDGWPVDDAAFDNAATAIWYFDGLQSHPMMNAERRARFAKLMARGVGLVALHQASTLMPDDKDIPLTDWLGGARYGMFDRTYESVAFQPANHPVSRGVGSFTLHDEFYPTVRFPSDSRSVPILSGTFYVEIENGKPRPLRIDIKPAAWAFERPNGGRGFSFTGLHDLVNLDHPQLRRLLLNAIVWTAQMEVPSTGIRSGVPDAATRVVASLGVKPTQVPAPRAPQTIVAKGILGRAADRKPEPQSWGELSFFVNRALKNSDTMTVLQSVIKPGQQNPRHYHPNCDEVLVVVQGRIIHMVNGEMFEMRAGDVLTIPQGAMHNARNIGNDDAILIVSYNSADRVSVGE